LEVTLPSRVIPNKFHIYIQHTPVGFEFCPVSFVPGSLPYLSSAKIRHLKSVTPDIFVGKDLPVVYR